MFKNIARLLGGDPIKRDIDRFTQVVSQINDLEAEYEKLDHAALRAKTDEFRARVQAGIENGRTQAEMLDEILPQAFAAVREASKRTLGQRHYDVQLIGGMALHNARIAEMRTGEGKTLVATLPSYLNALTGRGVHVITVNDYLARRDARWMAPIYNLLGLSVGVLQMAARTENGRKAFVVSLEKTSPQEDQHQLELVDRVEAYRADITYGTNSEFGFDYLRDNLANRLEERVQRGHYFAIVDEVDNILIDEARTPLIISGPAAENAEWYIKMAQVVRQLNPDDYEVNEKDRQVSLTEIGEVHVEELLEMPLRDPERPEDITPEQARAMGFLEQALRAQFLYHRNKEYLVQSGKVIIVDEFTGRLMPGRRWSEGLHQAVEAKEGVKIEPENVTYATITIQNYFRMYEKLSGMTGTALTESEEFGKIYKLDVLPIPMNLEFQATRNDSPLMAVEEKDEQGYRYTKYVRRSEPTRAVFFRRKDYPDVVYRTEEGKLRAIIQEIIYYHVIGRPQLVGTTSVEHSERLSLRLGAESIRRLLQALLLRHTWLEKYNQPAERDIPDLRFLNRPVDELNAGEMRALGRGLGLNSISAEEPENLNHLLAILGLNADDAPRLLRVVQGGIPHQVLNARKHDEESMIIARAGGFGMVTIATNMAGRGVDIKLGGELPESVLADVIRVLDRAGVDDPYDLTNDARRQELLKLDPAGYELYAESVQAFFKYLDDMAKVRELGGLHVIGSERHEARRIDNQLRGRAARQGDPGSSRFYLSLEDELMRLFGGGQVEGLMKRLAIDESMPIESGIIGRLVEQSQTRVEGNNFDVRKHLLEYDDVLNSQRKRIYAERDRTFTKEDLRDDVLDMLRTELQKRIPEALKDEEGPWKLLAYLEEIQPSSAFELENIQLPSFPVRLMAGELAQRTARDGGHEGLRTALISIAESALQEERDHILRSARTLLDRAEESYDQQRTEREDALDAFFDGLGEEEEGMPPRRPQEILDELSGLLRIPLRLTNEQMRQLPQGGDALREVLRQQVETGLIGATVTRVIGALERRLDEPLGLRANQLLFPAWGEIAGQLLQATQEALDRRSERLLGTRGQIYQNIDTILSQERRHIEDEDYYAALLMSMPVGTKVAIDPRSHRKGWRRVILLNYTFLAARLLGEMRPQDVSDAILEHLEGVLERLQRVWGLAEWERLTQNQIPLSGLISRVQEQAREALGAERFDLLANAPLSELSPEERSILVDLFGTRLQNEVYRQILLGVISELWVDYLTRVEALRVSIGLEAYAQRDPLVMYKGQASEMFGQLLSDIRMGVISRIFVVQPRRSSSAAAPTERGEVPPEAEVSADVHANPSGGEDRKKKRRRH